MELSASQNFLEVHECIWSMHVFIHEHWVCGESWLAIKDSLTHSPSSQGSSSKCTLGLFCYDQFLESCIYMYMYMYTYMYDLYAIVCLG